MFLYVIKCNLGSLGNKGWAVSEILHIKGIQEEINFDAYTSANSQDIGVFRFNDERQFRAWIDNERVKNFFEELPDRCTNLIREEWKPYSEQ